VAARAPRRPGEGWLTPFAGRREQGRPRGPPLRASGRLVGQSSPSIQSGIAPRVRDGAAAVEREVEQRRCRAPVAVVLEPLQGVGDRHHGPGDELDGIVVEARQPPERQQQGVLARREVGGVEEARFPRPLHQFVDGPPRVHADASLSAILARSSGGS
jgi:hypothetical protein